MTKKKLLLIAVSLMLFIGMLAISVPFASSMKPPRNAIDKWQVEIDPASLKPGELKRIADGQYGGAIWVYHRTEEQVRWLETHQPPELSSFFTGKEFSKEYGGQYRSLDNRYFVFITWEGRRGSYVREMGGWYFCGNLKYHDGVKTVLHGSEFNGVIACWADHEEVEFDRWIGIYDIAGNASSKYVAPLTVPNYEINRKGHIVVGPES